jgi:hypothetical protein
VVRSRIPSPALQPLPPERYLVGHEPLLGRRLIARIEFVLFVELSCPLIFETLHGVFVPTRGCLRLELAPCLGRLQCLVAFKRQRPRDQDKAHRGTRGPLNGFAHMCQPPPSISATSKRGGYGGDDVCRHGRCTLPFPFDAIQRLALRRRLVERGQAHPGRKLEPQVRLAVHAKLSTSQPTPEHVPAGAPVVGDKV